MKTLLTCSSSRRVGCVKTPGAPGSSSHLALICPRVCYEIVNKLTRQSHGALRNFRGHFPKSLVVFDVLRVRVKTVSAGINLYLKLGQFDLSLD